MKSVCIRSYSGLYSVRMQENTDQNNSEYGRFSRSAIDYYLPKFPVKNSFILEILGAPSKKQWCCFFGGAPCI